MATRSRKLTGSAGALLNYFGKQRAEDDELVFDEVWGKAAARLRLDGLTREQFIELANGRWEATRLVGATRGTVMIDVVFAGPKDVDEFLVACDDELRREVIAEFRESVRVAFRTLEENAQVAAVPVERPSEREPVVVHGPRKGEKSRMQGSRTERVTAELLAFPVMQYAARPTDATADRGVPDPHLHVHVPIFGVVWRPDQDDPTKVRTYTPDEELLRACSHAQAHHRPRPKVQRLRGYRSRLGAVFLLAVIFVLAPSAIWLLAMFATCVTLAQAGWLPPSFLRGPWAPPARCPCHGLGDRGEQLALARRRSAS